jgi:hypothetical protein
MFFSVPYFQTPSTYILLAWQKNIHAHTKKYDRIVNIRIFMSSRIIGNITAKLSGWTKTGNTLQRNIVALSRTTVAMKSNNAFCRYCWATCKNIKILSVAQQCSYGKFMSVRPIKRTWNVPDILCFVDHAYRYNSCKWPTWRTILFSYMFIPKSVHGSSTHALIIRRINCINTTSGTCHCI